MLYFVSILVLHHLEEVEKAGPEVIKLEFILRLKIKRYDWLLANKQPIIALYFEFENELNFYNLEAWLLWYY